MKNRVVEKSDLTLVKSLSDHSNPIAAPLEIHMGSPYYAFYAISLQLYSSNNSAL